MGGGVGPRFTPLAVLLGVTVIFGLNGLLPAFMQAFNRNLLSTAGKIDVTVFSTFNEPFSSDVVDKIARVPGVAVVTPEIQRIVPLPLRTDIPSTDQVAQLNIIGVDTPTAVKVRDFPLTSGRMLAASDTDAMVLSSDLAARLGVSVGDELALPSSVGTTKYAIVGLLSTATLPGAEQAFVPLASAQRLFAFGQRINTVEAAFRPGVDRAVVEAAMSRALGSDSFISASWNFSLRMVRPSASAIRPNTGSVAVTGLPLCLSRSWPTRCVMRSRSASTLSRLAA